jgi:hypothetical protein
VISADPVAFLLVMSGRLGQWAAIALGLMSASGDRPELALGMTGLFRYPGWSPRAGLPWDLVPR